MNLTPLILEPLPPLPKFTVSPDAEQRRNELILVVRSFAVVKTAAEANSLGEAARDLRTHIADVKEQNLGWRRPINDALSRSIAIEKDYIAPALAELECAERLQGEFHAAEKRRVEEAERQRRAEIERLEKERLAAEQKARDERERIDRENREAEQKRITAEAERVRLESEAMAKVEALKGKLYNGETYEVRLVSKNKVDVIGFTDDEFGSEFPCKNLPQGTKLHVVKITSGKARDMMAEANKVRVTLEAERQKRQAEADEAAQKEEKSRQEALAAQRQASDDAIRKAKEAAAASEAAMRAPLPEIHKVAGVATKRVMEFEVLDIKAVFAARPELCEPLAIKKSAVRAVCTPKFLPASDEIDDTTIPGLRLWWADQTVTKRWT